MTTARRLIALLSVLFLVPLLAVTTQTSSASAADDALFSALPGFRPSGPTAVKPLDYRAYRVDLAGVRAALAGAGSSRLSIPDPAGTPTGFTLAEDSVMAASMQAAHPDIRTYRGAAANGTTVRLDVTPLGFHAMVRRPDGVVWYVEPATRAVGEDRVLSFAGAAAGDPGSTFVEQEVRTTTDKVAADAGASDFSTPGGIVSQRTYRLALVTDPAYAAYVAPGATTHAVADDLVLAAKTTLVNRVNEAYNDDVAYKFTMIAGTDTKLNLLTTAEMSGPNGPCGASACFPDATGAYDCGSVLDRNPFALGMLIGAENFDIGHIGVGVNGGGIAGLGVVGTADKAIGCTGVPTPVGDVYAIDYVAHEMGHQMGGNHTFNGVQTNCSAGNRNAATSVEPGSGVTIMAYAGICSSDDLQPHSDPYFSFKSIEEFEANAAAAPGNETEQQVVALQGFDATDSFTLTGSAGTSGTVANGSNYNAVGLAAAVLAATGQVATITRYDAPGAPNANGFTVSFASTANQQTLVVNPVSGTFTSKVGTIVNGGPDTNGGTVSATADHSPVVTAPVDKTIPTRTPFTLTGSATDADAGDTLTYLWEQTDRGIAAGTGLVSNTKANGPLFRVFGTYADVSEPSSLLYSSPGENLAGTSPSRTFPDLPQVLVGNTNAKTGACPAPAAAGTVPVSDPALNCFSEFLPTSAWFDVPAVSHVMHFRLTARDEFSADAAADHPGGASFDDVALTVAPAAGPFLVTSRPTASTAFEGSSEAVTWSVAGTNTAAMATTVKISLSVDGGLTYPHVLAASTANDGSESVTLPAGVLAPGGTARIKVEAVGNYFFAVNDAGFSIVPSGSNTAPVVNAGPDRSTTVGTAFTSSGSFTDEAPGSATATVDYGDGAGPQALALTGTTFALSHTYATAGTKTVTVKVTDSGSLSGTDTATVTVTPGSTSLTPSVTKAAAVPKKIVKGKGFKAAVTVSATGAVPSGTVQVYKGGKLLGAGRLVDGKVTIKVSRALAKKLKVGKNTLTAKYLGSATVAASQADFVIKVRKKR